MPAEMWRQLRGWFATPPAAPPPRPDLILPEADGPMVWVRIGAGYEQAGAGESAFAPALIQLLAQLRRCGMQIVVSQAVGGPPDLSTRGVAAIEDAALSSLLVEGYLDVIDPRAILLIGTDLPRALLDAAAVRSIPVILAEARFASPRQARNVPRLRRSALSRVTRVLLPDSASRDAAIDLGARPQRVEMTGPIAVTREPLKYLEAERAVLAEALSGRQLWLAVCVTEDEDPALIDAQLMVLTYSHRALLIVLPDNPGRAKAMAARFEAAGLVVAQRSLDEDPTEEVNVYLADDPFELGLWYRLAPVCFMGTTLSGPTDAARDPFEAASLGSAAIHGPLGGAYAAEWAQLDGAQAARAVDEAAALPQAVVELLAADQAATVAANAWSVSTGGAGVSNRIAHVVRDIIRKNAP